MSILLAALGVGILSYVGFVLLFPKAVPEDTGDHVRDALDRIYEENRVNSDQTTVLRDQLREESPLVRGIFGLAFMQPLYEAGMQAGYQQSMKQLLVLVLGILVVAMLLFYLLGLGPIGFLLALIMAYYVPYRHCRKRINARNRKFIDQFPDALDMIVRSVKSGFPLSVALQMLAENTENPIREEFQIVVEDIALGRSLHQALTRLAGRINEPDIRFFVVVLSVQQETGGNLAEIIGNLSNIIRKRKQLRHKIHAMTSEGRATGWVLGALPVLLFTMLYILQPDYLSPLWTSSLGHILLGTAAGLMIACFFTVRQLINVDI